MKLTHVLKKMLADIAGYSIYKNKFLPVGADLVEDITHKIQHKINIIFDVGANVGQTALELSGGFPKSTIFAFEPFSETFSRLQKNTSSKKNIACHCFALSDKEEIKNVKIFGAEYSELNSLNTYLMNDSPNAVTESIKTITIDDFMFANKIAVIDLLKIDTEGYEISVLNGANMALQKGNIKMIYLEIGFSKTDDRHSYFPLVHEFLEKYSFSFFGMYKVAHSTKLNYHFANALYIHNSCDY